MAARKNGNGEEPTEVTLADIARGLTMLTETVNQLATNVNALTTEMRADHRHILRIEERVRTLESPKRKR